MADIILGHTLLPIFCLTKSYNWLYIELKMWMSQLCAAASEYWAIYMIDQIFHLL